MIRIGPAGWSYADWEGIVYPREKPRGFHPLRHLARYVDCVEINSSFYAMPRAEHAARWVTCVADRPDFRFTAKLLQAYTHDVWDRARAEAARDVFLSGLEPLRTARKLAGLLVQFPWSFRDRPEARKRLESIAELFGEVPLIVELRHRSWFDREALESVGGLGYSIAHIDLPHASDHPPPDPPVVGGAHGIGYLRVHGRNSEAWFDSEAGRDRRYDYLYGADELVELARTTRRLASGTDETFVITNNHFSGKAVANALELLALLGDGPPLAPIELVRAYPRLNPQTRAEGQGDLF